MKNQFFAFIKPSDEEFRELWNSCIFTFDANILLNFYRYKNETTNSFFDLLENLADRVQLTYQATCEYFDNRLDIISKQEKTYSEVRDAIQKQIEDPLQNQRNHPHINNELLIEFVLVAEKVKNELDERSKEYSQRISEDDILNKIVKIFDEKIGESFSDEKLDEIYIEGDKRYNENIPPGFEDKSKGGTRQYGDLVLWYQMIEISKSTNKDIIFVTDDEKKDWVYIHLGRTISPLPALQNEFFKLTGRKFYIYTAVGFMEFASKFLRKEISEEAIEEVRNIQEENKIISFYEPIQNEIEDPKEHLTDEDIDKYLETAIRRLENEQGWTELASLGVYLNRKTPIDYRSLGYPSLRRFIETRGLFDVKMLQKSPNAKAVDTAFVRLKTYDK